MKQKKTCGKNQHVRIDNIYRKANLICCRTDDAVEINLRYYTLSVKAAEATAEGISIFKHCPKGKVAQAYQGLTMEVLANEK